MRTEILISLQYTFQKFFGTAARVKFAKPSKQPNSDKTTEAFIQCKRSVFNALQFCSSDSKFGSIPLASNGWHHRKSKGDFFIIHPIASECEVYGNMVDYNDIRDSTDQIKINTILLENLRKNFEIKKLTPVQAEGFPKIYNDHHVIITAETGCGKTLTYLLPIIQKVLERKSSSLLKFDRQLNSPFVVILCPGRELATQIGSVATNLCQSSELIVKTVVGGNTKQQMMNPEFAEVDILVATVGAISKLVTTGIYRMKHVRHLVLDEADTLLDDSFSEKLSNFLLRFPFHKNSIQIDEKIGTQLVLASATMPTNISPFIQKLVEVSTLHQVVSRNLHRLAPHIQQKFLRTNKEDRPGILLNLVKTDLAKNRPSIIFSNKSSTCDYISLFLNNSGVKCVNLNGDMLMKIRVGRFQQFQNGEFDVLSTTDIGSRGLDTIRARHVINFDFPLYMADYIHRSGRIGRKGMLKKCLVTNLVSSQREIGIVQRIEHAARTGGVLPNVDGNISNIIRTRIINQLEAAGVANDDVFL